MDWFERILWMLIGVSLFRASIEIKKWYYQGKEERDYARMIKQACVTIAVIIVVWYGIKRGWFFSGGCEDGYDARGCL